MCVIYFAFGAHCGHPLILLANRDEFYNRPTRAAGFWNDHPQIYGGRDLAGGGTWLGVTKSGRFAAVTNYRDPSAPAGTLSRGNLVADFLKSIEPAADFLRRTEAAANDYSGFNLIAGEVSAERRELFYCSNRGDRSRELAPGIYGLSNHLLDTPWPKVANGKERFAAMISSGEASDDRFFEILADESLAADDELPSTGVPFEIEKAISAIFIKTPVYGTRCSSVLTFDNDLNWNLEERVFV